MPTYYRCPNYHASAARTLPRNPDGFAGTKREPRVSTSVVGRDAKSGCGQPQRAALFDHFVGAGARHV